MRLLRRLTLIALLGGLFAWLRKVMSEDIVARSSQPQSSPEPPTPPVDGVPAPKPAPEKAVGANGGEPTKAELYERAQQLGIEGRSKMSKSELRRAIERAG